ncbi:MAG: grasp-with-spasm system ATP-grasp peptide maturase [Bacteroidota bacterium]
MILLMSQVETEFTTNEVIDWLMALDADFVRINGKDLQVEDQRLSLSDEQVDYRLWVEGKEIDFAQINIIWFRRWSRFLNRIALPGEDELEADFHRHRKAEFKTLSSSFFYLMENKKWLSKPLVLRKKDWTKFEYLRMAKKAQICIPDSLVATNKKSVSPFIEKHGQVIIKPLSEGSSFVVDDVRYATYTAKVEIETLDLFPDHFFPTLFQELLEKEIELRIFYFDQTFYTMAIFSTLDNQTAVDFRRYNHHRPNRMVPYRLPEEQEEKLLHFLELVDMDNGSIDMIKTKDGRYVFLEINPLGQFGMVSTPCCYNLEKKVAQYLIRQDQKSTSYESNQNRRSPVLSQSVAS